METDITQSLKDWAAGDATALNRIAPHVYPKLQELAKALFFRERKGHTWQPTILVNELFIKLLGQREPRFENRVHFYSVCARLMRLALVDHARGVNREKRGGALEFVPLHEDVGWFNVMGAEALDYADAMAELSKMDSLQAELFEARYLLGCSVEETADMFDVSKSTVDRKTRVARAWLYRRLTGAAGQPAETEL
jgi:RNA polymerase sigma factor (TIGR02999 family)